MVVSEGDDGIGERWWYRREMVISKGDELIWKEKNISIIFICLNENHQIDSLF